ncbi:hypothetical protein BDW42DRAFT_170677 [Aspergillus taichungensis]|uniref:Nuclear pore complex protein Nup85 n=1 Tax=Aspergillus taichungensis TaxID=482145 RepID=A0A2J5HTD7_9EURO|nr:hypothetical protein BDW42DRAFT_170677 [Aspergillus taichungensis]
MTFKVPFDSSPPSTPGKSGSLFSNLSNTPAGNPPSGSSSFDPHGRSQMESPQSLFSRSNFENDSIFGSSIASPGFLPPRARKAAPVKPSAPAQSLFSMAHDSQFGQPSKYGALNSFGSSQMEEDIQQDADGDADIPEEDEGPPDDLMGFGQTKKAPGPRFSFLDSQFGNPAGPSLSNPAAPSFNFNAQRKPIYTNPTNAKRPKLDEKWAQQSPLRKVKLPPKKDSAMPSIVRNFASHSRLAAVEEPSDFIIKTEDEISRLFDEARRSEYHLSYYPALISDICDKLVTVWKPSGGPPRPGAGVGPGEHGSNVAKASFLGSLLLQLHHPPPAPAKLPSWPGAFGFGPRALTLGNHRAETPTPLPKVLLDWLNANHGQAFDIQSLKEAEPNPTASPNFWETINAAVLRGQISETVDILRSADFNYARSALEDGLPQAGYRGAQLQNIQRCVNKALQVLESCPSVQSGDWDVRGAEWAMFRRRVLVAVTDLEEFAEGDEQSPDSPAVDNLFQAPNFGLATNPAKLDSSFTQSARMAESRVPWSIYQSLRFLYRIILGDTSAITNQAQDWVEATVGLTVWWDGEDDEGPHREPGESYLHRLDLALSSATNSNSNDAKFRINSLSSLEVGLASVFEGNVGGVIGLLETWSLCVASAVAEVAETAGWLHEARKALPGLNEDDLMVLSYGQENGESGRGVNKNDVMSAYASGLFERPIIENESGTREGWELALEVLSRLDDKAKMQKSVSELLDKLPLDTSEQMDRVVLLCSELGLDNEGRRVSERYGDITVANSDEYGLALVCYARAHSRRKVKSVVDLLISYSLVRSCAFPAAADLDEQLETMIRRPRECLTAVASADEEAATILQFYFSGYATLRRFYEIRDEGVNLKEGQRPRFKPLARRRAAAQALVAVITSAADSIYGGLYDPERDSSVQVDGLLTLLGEALAFLDQPTPIFSVPQQFAILSAIEDLETVTPRVYGQCEECFRSTLLEYQSTKRGPEESQTAGSFFVPPSPRALLKKSMSGGTGSSTFSFIGSEMVESSRPQSGHGSVGSSGVLVPRAGDGLRGHPEERGWDWRAGLAEGSRGEDILRVLRLGLARGLSFGALGSI